jgi:hypothetical protein
MKPHSFVLTLAFFVLLGALVSAQVGAEPSAPQIAAGALPQGLLATPTLRAPKDVSSLYLPLVQRDAGPPLPPIIPPT